jgi:hypothetical protein
MCVSPNDSEYTALMLTLDRDQARELRDASRELRIRSVELVAQPGIAAAVRTVGPTDGGSLRTSRTVDCVKP